LASDLNEEELSENVIAAYPNPFENDLYIQTKNAERVELLNINGNVVRSFEVLGEEVKANTDDISAGIYLLRVIADNGNVIYTQKLIKK
jgi:hypothetical protein